MRCGRITISLTALSQKWPNCKILQNPALNVESRLVYHPPSPSTAFELFTDMQQDQTIMSGPTTIEPPCYLLRLPAELRNTIYEHVFDCTTEREVELRTATPPSNSLLLTSHEVCNETAKMYKRCYRKYWTTTRFHIDGDDPELSLNGKAIFALDKEALEHIAHCRVACRYDSRLYGAGSLFKHHTLTLSGNGRCIWEWEMQRRDLPPPRSTIRRYIIAGLESQSDGWVLHPFYNVTPGWVLCYRSTEDELRSLGCHDVAMAEQIVSLLKAVRNIVTCGIS